MNNIYLIVGESGSGKTTIANNFLKMYGWKQIESYTTRPKRKCDETGHIFVGIDEMPNQEDMVAYTYYAGNHYWATSEQVENCDLYVVDMNGVKMLKQKYKGNKGIKVIYLSVDENDRKVRMNKRGDSLNLIKQRARIDREAFVNVEYDISIQNDVLSETLVEIYEYIMEMEKE